MIMDGCGQVKENIVDIIDKFMIYEINLEPL